MELSRRGALAGVVRAQEAVLRWLPWLPALFWWLVRFRWLVLVLITVACAIVPQADPLPTDIDVFFLSPALRLVQHADLSVFAPEIQIGPLCLALLGLGAAAGEATGLPPTFGASLLLGFVALLVVAVTVRAVVPTGTSGRRLAAYQLCLGVVLIWGTVPLATSYGHIEEMFLALMLVLAAVQARRGRGGRAGLWLAVAVGFKLWAAIGIVVLVLSSSRRTAVMAAGIGIVGGAAAYLPFVLSGNFRTFDFHWTVQKFVPMSLLLGVDAPFGFGARSVQVALACGVALAVAVRMRSDPRAVWLVPATLIAVRLLADPMLLPYYWTGLVACFILGVVLTDWRLVLRGAAAIALPAVVLPTALVLRDHPNRAVLTGLAIGAVVACLLSARRPRQGKVTAEVPAVTPDAARILA